jgi:hypothetical protein
VRRVAYPWPLEPFDRAHPVRGYFNDPRISGSSRAFHFGIDIAAPNGTPVFAVAGGTVHLENPRAVSVAAAGVEFGYWHIVPAVTHLQRVSRHQLLGHIAAPWLHVHFAERRGGLYRNPLRSAGLEPWKDTSRPKVTAIRFLRNGRELAPAMVRGAVDVVAEAHDMPPLPVPSPWAGLPVTPARIRWRVLRSGNVVRRWHTPVDFSRTMIPKERFRSVYAPGTRQNHAGSPGLYRFFLAHTWSTGLLPDGPYRLEVEASDLGGNAGFRSLAFTVANDL